VRRVTTLAVRAPLISEMEPEEFIERAGIELHRAERYRVFVSLSVLDMGSIADQLGDEFSSCASTVAEALSNVIRKCDYATCIDDTCLAVLFPETPRQGAEVATRRLTDLVKEKLFETTGKEISRTLPVEIASYPDTGGTKTLDDLLKEFAKKTEA